MFEVPQSWLGVALWNARCGVCLEERGMSARRIHDQSVIQSAVTVCWVVVAVVAVDDEIPRGVIAKEVSWIQHSKRIRAAAFNFCTTLEV